MQISLIIPCFNAQDYIKEALKSCIEQSFSNNLEVIVVDDCSSDSSAKVVRAFALEHSVPLQEIDSSSIEDITTHTHTQ